MYIVFFVFILLTRLYFYTLLWACVYIYEHTIYIYCKIGGRGANQIIYLLCKSVYTYMLVQTHTHRVDWILRGSYTLSLICTSRTKWFLQDWIRLLFLWLSTEGSWPAFWGHSTKEYLPSNTLQPQFSMATRTLYEK